MSRKSDPRQKRTRRLLANAMRKLVREKTFSAITVQQIAEEATVNRATFYDHFEDKFALMEYCLRSEFEQVLEGMRLDESECTLATLSQLIKATCIFLLDFQGTCIQTKQTPDSRFEVQIISQLHEIMDRWLQQIAVEPRQLQATIISWSIYGAAVHWKQVHTEMALDPYVQQVLPLLAANLSTIRAA